LKALTHVFQGALKFIEEGRGREKRLATLAAERHEV
jgi:hypothetical protein